VINALYVARISSLEIRLKNCKIAIILTTISVLMSGCKRRKDVLSVIKMLFEWLNLKKFLFI
jgi:hypothetical protein